MYIIRSSQNCEWLLATCSSLSHNLLQGEIPWLIQSESCTAFTASPCTATSKSNKFQHANTSSLPNISSNDFARNPFLHPIPLTAKRWKISLQATDKRLNECLRYVHGAAIKSPDHLVAGLVILYYHHTNSLSQLSGSVSDYLIAFGSSR